MIIVRLKGGLGNQMFQYAAARRLALHHGTELKLDLSFFNGSQIGCARRFYELDNFCIQASIASHSEISEMTGRGRTRLETALIYFRQATGLAKLNRNVYLERHFHTDATVLDLPDNVYLDGYWQSEQYFLDSSHTIRDDFRFRNVLLAESQLYYDAIINDCNAVSLHIRRGDYISCNKTSEHHGYCDLDYYHNAIKMIVNSVPKPHFFVFSDDIDWAIEHLNIDYPVTFVKHTSPENDCNDMLLMSICRHNIIANSTFSWWGAWLNPNTKKIVLAPFRWFNNLTKDTKDLFPVSWQRVSNAHT